MTTRSFAASTTTSVLTGVTVPKPRYFHSRRVRKEEVEKPWLEHKDPREKWVTIIPVIGMILGLGLAGFLIYDGIHSVSNYNYCILLDEDWSKGFNNKVWTKEVELGGYGYDFCIL